MVKALCACSRRLLNVENRNFVYNAVPYCNRRECIELCQKMQSAQIVRRHDIAERDAEHGRYIGLSRGG